MNWKRWVFGNDGRRAKRHLAVSCCVAFVVGGYALARPGALGFVRGGLPSPPPGVVIAAVAVAAVGGYDRGGLLVALCAAVAVFFVAVVAAVFFGYVGSTFAERLGHLSDLATPLATWGVLSGSVGYASGVVVRRAHQS